MIVIDARRLEPPEPFERLLETLAVLQPQQQVLLILAREPRPLYRFLNQNDYGYEANWFDGQEPRWEVRIWERD
jgi:uncharacterized protein (DUF2249 family)